MKKFSILFVLLFCAFSFLKAQEIKSSVRIITPQLQNTDRKTFDVLEGAIRDWINNTKWTNDKYEQEERIEVNITITVAQEVGENAFDCDLAIQSNRPVYGSGYKTPLLSHLDKDFTFTYDIYQPLDFSVEAITNNMTATLAFYIYVILGMDYDSFSLFGGEEHFNTAQRIINSIPPGMASSFNGWQAPDGGKNRNRFWIMENIFSPRIRPFRQAMYNYHLNGLDLFSSDPEKGRKGILDALGTVEKVSNAYINSMILQMFANAKKDELVEMWKLGQPAERKRVFEIMTKIDPANAVRYREVGI